ncbi:queuosine precursor transporter [Pseudomonas baetica]|uniref:queuosine precursor transporter n=1 Tax=Pseudomonas baetica TaxID=674054 RepID=UPI003EEFC9CD
MASEKNGGNSRYKLLGFENDKRLAVVMVISTGKIVKVKLGDLLKGEMIDDLNRAELREVYKKFYSRGTAVTAYEITDRHEESWIVYVALNLLLFTLYVFSNVAAAKVVYVEMLDVVVTPGLFLYPLTFLIVDLLNEFYGFRLARRAILFAFAGNAFVIVLLAGASYLPGLPGWEVDAYYGVVVNHVSSVLLASSVSFLCSEYINSYLLCRIKELTNSRFLFLRVFFSTFFAVIIDSLVFCFIAFYWAMEYANVMALVYVQIVIKMCFAVFNVLPAYGARSLFRKYVTVNQVA